MAPLDIKSDFQLFDTNPDFAYFDSTSTTLVPKVSVDTVCDFLSSTVASARRGAHHLAVKGSSLVEDSRRTLAKFLDTDPNRISFQKSISSAVASFVLGYDWQKTKKNQIIVAQSEEHSVLVAIQRVTQILNLKLDVIRVQKDGNLDLDHFNKLLSNKTGIVAVGSTSIGIGANNPLEEIAKITHENEALLLSEITRSVGFERTNPSSLGPDILIFSGNINLMGPPGLAIQWIEETIGNTHTPAILGGSSVANVEHTSFETALQPDKFESGMLNIPAIVGLGASLQYLDGLHSNGLSQHLQNIAAHLLSRLKNVPDLVLYGNPTDSRTIFGVNLGSGTEISCHDVALFLDESGIAVRSGLLCAHPLVKPMSDEGFIQISLHGYNTIGDVDRLADSLEIIAEQLI
jgi:cysteine desulfurase/selenocysteine lyase